MQYFPYDLTDIATACKTVWKLPAIQETLTNNVQFAIASNLEYFFDKIHIIMSDEYQISHLDFMKVRQKTSGTRVSRFNVDLSNTNLNLNSNSKEENYHLRVFDVGGQRAERRKWLNHFDRLSIVAFVLHMCHSV